MALVGAEGGPFTVAAFFDPEGDRVLTTAIGGACSVRSSRTGVAHVILLGHDGAVTSAAWSPSGDLIATASEDASVKVWAADLGECIRTLRAAPVQVGIALRGVWWAEEERLWACAADGRVLLWNLPDERVFLEFDGQLGPLTAITSTATAIAEMADA